MQFENGGPDALGYRKNAAIITTFAFLDDFAVFCGVALEGKACKPPLLKPSCLKEELFPERFPEREPCAVFLCDLIDDLSKMTCTDKWLLGKIIIIFDEQRQLTDEQV